MDRFRQDLRHAVRQLAGNRTFTLLAVATLALGIGANAAIFSVVNGVMLRPLPYPDPERVTYLSWNWQNGQIGALSAYKYEHWREHSLVFDGVATLNTMLAEVRVGDAVDEVQGMRITEDFLRVIGLPPILGRDFRAEEDEPGGPLAAILSHEFWRDRLDADP
ncbi:MAG: ABC transporter permease, partial [Longimicrobiales bacterium]